MFDVRPGEYVRVTCTTLYLMVVLFAYYILKPVSRSLFLNRFDIDKLPWLYVLIAAVGGVLAYLYTKVAVNSSLRRAVDFATVFSIAVLVAFWWLIQLNIGWIVYAFNIWVSLFSIILVSQGWLIAANIFTSREAKRLYGILGVGSVVGAAFGGTFTAYMVKYIGTTNLILASAAMVGLSYIPFLYIAKDQASKIARAPAAEDAPSFGFGEIVTSLRRHRHLQVIIAIMVVTFVIDVMVEFQFNVVAKMAYHNRTDLTAFLGNFYGFWLNLVTFVCVFFLTNFVVSRFGVGGTLQIMPVSIALASLAALISPSVLSMSAARLTEASTRYSFNKTGMELLYLPLPLELRNRTKAFVDVFVDRFARGIGGMILVLFTTFLASPLKPVAVAVLVFSAAWIILSAYAKREYIATVKKRLETRRLDLESARISVDDPSTIALLEQLAVNEHPRQALYALSLLNEAQHYNPAKLLPKLVESRSPEIRAQAYELAAKGMNTQWVDRANAEIRSATATSASAPVRSAVVYTLSVAPEPRPLIMLLLNHPNPQVVEGVLEYLAKRPELAREMIGYDWLAEAAQSSDVRRRCLAALAVRARGDSGTESLHRLLEDEDPSVVVAACQSAAALQNREYLMPMVRKLSDPRLRGVVVDALASFGDKTTGMLADLIEDETVPMAVRRQAPRVLRLIPTQRAVDALLRLINHRNVTIRAAVIRALNRLRENAPGLDYGPQSVREQIMTEARFYFDLAVAVEALPEHCERGTAAALLSVTLRQRLKSTIERLFRLLGLQYPQGQIHAAYLAVSRGQGEDVSAAMEFLDHVLDRDIKRVIVPILDDPSMQAQHGRELFGIEEKKPEDVMRELMESGDEWLVACAIATAAQLNMRSLVPNIQNSISSDGDVSQVARDAMVVLA